MLTALTAAGRQAPGPGERDAEDEQGARAPHGAGSQGPKCDAAASPAATGDGFRSLACRPAPPHSSVFSAEYSPRDCLASPWWPAGRAGSHGDSRPEKPKRPAASPLTASMPRPESGAPPIPGETTHATAAPGGAEDRPALATACGSQELQQDSCDSPFLNRTLYPAFPKHLTSFGLCFLMRQNTQS